MDPSRELDPETINAWRQYFRQEMEHQDPRDIMIEGAVNARIAVRVLYRIFEPRLRDVEVRQKIFLGVVVTLSIVLPILMTWVMSIMGGHG